jgi:rare lipoprotein A
MEVVLKLKFPNNFIKFYADNFNMKKIFLALIVLFVMVFIIPIYVQAQETEVFRQEGIASWYGKEFDGRPTASGEIFDSTQLTAAHPSLPFGTMLVITNQHNNKKVTVRVNDRGPFVSARIVDVSRAAAEQLDMIITGTAPVLIESTDRIVITNPVVETPSVQVTVQPVVTTNEVNTITTTIPVSAPAVVNVSQPVVVHAPVQVNLTPQINIMPNKTYRLQVGSYRVARNAVDAFDRLKNSGLNPAYERFINTDNNEFFRVVVAGISGSDVQSTVEKLGEAGFKEALIREEN